MKYSLQLLFKAILTPPKWETFAFIIVSSFSVAQRKWMKKKNPPHFSQEFGSFGGQGNSKTGLLTLRKDEGLQQPAGASLCSGCETFSAAGADGSQQQACIPAHSKGIHRRHLQHKMCLNRAPQHCQQSFMLLHYLSRHWLGWTSACVWIHGAIFSLSWKCIFCRPAQTCSLKPQGLILNIFRKGLQIADHVKAREKQKAISSNSIDPTGHPWKPCQHVLPQFHLYKLEKKFHSISPMKEILQAQLFCWILDFHRTVP